MPRWMSDHLSRPGEGYDKFPDFLKVIEAAAKMMSAGVDNFVLARPEQKVYADLLKNEAKGRLGITEEDTLKAFRDRIIVAKNDARIYLKKYFQAVKDEHGESAFDKLVHITTEARKIKEEFLNANTTGNTNRPVEQPIENNVAGVGGGGRGDGQGPPKPPYEPPEWDNNPDEPEWRKKFPPSTIEGGQTTAYPTEPWQDGPQHASLPENLVEMVRNARSRNWNDKQVSYIQNVLKALHGVASGITPKESALYKTLRDAEDYNWDTGYKTGLIWSIVENHIHHIWGEDPKRGYPSIEHASAGSFAINATQARHRSWGTAFEGILQGRQLKVHDPVSLISHDAANIAEASANRRVLEAIRNTKKLDKDGNLLEVLKDPEGMPLAILRGMGRQVPSPDGTKSSILVNPNVVTNVMMDAADVQRLRQSGLLGTYIKDGRVVDHTPKVDQSNVKDWILATQKKLDKLLTANPLLANRQQHEAGWGQLQEFAKTQAGKIADYLDNAIKSIKNEGQPDGKNYQALPREAKAADFNMAGSFDKVIHGDVAGGKITPEDMRRIEKYAERNRLYAEGKSSIKHGTEDFVEKGIRPGEIARLLEQEQNHLDPELQKYLSEHHDLFHTDQAGKAIRGENSTLTRKGVGTAIKYIAHAAETPLYPQLIQDKFNLLRADHLLSSNPLTREHPETKAEIEQHFKDINARQPEQYLWAPKSHITIDHPSFHGYKWMATAADGTPTLAESDIAVSRYIYKYLKNRLGLEPSKLREPEGLGKITAPLLKVGSQFKNTILSGSPFHLMQIALRGLMLHVNPFVRPNPLRDLEVPFESVPDADGQMRKPTLRLGVENSLTIFQNRHGAEDSSVGVASHGGLVSKIPIYGPITDQIHDLLFNRLIPSIKADGFKQMFNEYAKAHPDWTDDAIAYHAAQHTNNAFGGINWKEMGRSATTQDWFHLVALAPDWLESEMRFAAGIFNGAGIGPAKYEPEQGKNFTRTQVAQTAVALWVIARVVNKLYSGSPHYEAPFGLATKDKDGREVVYSVRTMPTDILHMASEPGNFLNGLECLRF